jgi:hypothetical protein
MDKVKNFLFFLLFKKKKNFNSYVKLQSEEKKTWIITLFFGAMMLFAVRTVMSVCALEISKEFNYDKTQMVSSFRF